MEFKCRLCGETSGLAGMLLKQSELEDICTDCSPTHIFGGNAVEIFDDGEWDIDAFAPCWKYGN